MRNFCILFIYFTGYTLSYSVPLLIVDRDTKEIYGQIDSSELRLIQMAAKDRIELLEAEKEGRITAETKKEWIIKEGKETTYPIFVTWYGRSRQILKTVELQVKFESESKVEATCPESDGIVTSTYKKIAAWGFPIVTSILIIVILVL